VPQSQTCVAMTPKEFLETQAKLSPNEKLASMVRVLTGPQGCPWDQKQSAESIIDYVIDEAHELKASLLANDPKETASELGDLLFTVEFLSQSLDSQAPRPAAVDHLVEKMIRRHPHVFGDVEFKDEEALKRNWEAEKRKESVRRKRLDEDLPTSLPPLQKATKVLSRAMNSGFRYLRVEDALDKVWEEVMELESCLHADEERFEEEFGDVILALLTVAKMKNCNPDNALQRGVTKFCDRLQQLEVVAGKPLEEIPHSELGEHYQSAKTSPAEGGAFFNYCGVSPWPRPVRNEIRRACQRLGTSGLKAVLEMREERERFRGEIRDFCSAPANSHVVYVPNVSSAALGVAFAQDWKAGDKILLGRTEFPANTAPWCAAAKTFNLETLWFEDDLLRRESEKGWRELEQVLESERPRLLAISAVSFWSGFRVSLERLGNLCQRSGTRLFVDAIQALGTTPQCWARGVDYLTCGSHKSLTSPEGSGFLIIGSEVSKDWVPRLSSWLSLPQPVDFLVNGRWMSLPREVAARTGDPSVLEFGSLNTLGYAGLAASIRHLSELGLEGIYQRVLSLQDPLEEAMRDLGWESLRSPCRDSRSGILSFRPPEGVDVAAIQQALAKLGISVGIPNGVLRFGFHTFTKVSEVERAIQAIRSFL
jgi:MazG family protein